MGVCVVQLAIASPVIVVAGLLIMITCMMNRFRRVDTLVLVVLHYCFCWWQRQHYMTDISVRA